MIINMDKAKFYLGLSQFFSSSVVSWKCDVTNGQLISGTQVLDYRLLGISDFFGNEEATLWISGFQNKVPNAEIRVGNRQQKPAGIVCFRRSGSRCEKQTGKCWWSFESSANSQD